MPMLTPDQRATLMMEIEGIVLSGKWGIKAMHILARKYDVAVNAIVKHHKNYVALRRQVVDGKTLAEQQADTWAAWEQAFDTAAAKKDPNAMARLLRVRSSWLNMDHAPKQTEPTRLEIVSSPGTTPPDREALRADIDAIPVTEILASLERRRQGPAEGE